MKAKLIVLLLICSITSFYIFTSVQSQDLSSNRLKLFFEKFNLTLTDEEKDKLIANELLPLGESAIDELFMLQRKPSTIYPQTPGNDANKWVYDVISSGDLLSYIVTHQRKDLLPKMFKIVKTTKQPFYKSNILECLSGSLSYNINPDILNLLFVSLEYKEVGSDRYNRICDDSYDSLTNYITYSKIKIEGLRDSVMCLPFNERDEHINKLKIWGKSNRNLLIKKLNK